MTTAPFLKVRLQLPATRPPITIVEFSITFLLTFRPPFHLSSTKYDITEPPPLGENSGFRQRRSRFCAGKLLSTLPGVILALVVGSLRYDFELQFSLLIVPAFTLVMLMATSVGYAIALLSPKAELVNVLTNLIIFSLFLFSPVNFPVERLPLWLATIHRFLPVMYAADAVRGALVPDYSDRLGLALAVLGVWCLVGLVINYMVTTRRG